MDESLTAFQETQNKCAGPKTTSTKNSKSRKAPKRPRGQKDIRTVLRSVKNELESYSKDFDKVCKKAGIDVDSEQLQLAIALSKSLQDTASTPKDSAEIETIAPQSRIGKIRTTLQEYGFKVPEVKIVGNTCKIRKHRKYYKLVQTTDIEKNEIIANRYSRILFNDITHCNLVCSDIDFSNIPLYYLASSVSYDVLKTINTFYVDNLIDKCTSTGILLKDWSKIPGRPESPKLFEPMSMSFSEIECSQDELNIILSGSLKSCKDIVINKITDWHNSNDCKLDVDDNISIEKESKEEIKDQDNTLIKNTEDSNRLKLISAVNNYRSCSPDMFDDDDPDILVESKSLSQKENCTDEYKTDTNINLELVNVSEKSQFQLNLNVTNRKSNNMELTKCIHIQIKDNITIVDQFSQKTNATKRRSNDFMELTECVATSSQPLRNKIDLIQGVIEENNLLDETVDKVKQIIKPSTCNDIDLTESENISIPKEVNSSKDIECMDLTQSSNTSDELPFVSLTATENKCLYDPDDTVVIVDVNDNAHIDLTQSIQRDNNTNMQSQSFFDEYNHDHSDSLDQSKESISDVIVPIENQDKIDLTQSIERKSLNNTISSNKSKGNLEEDNFKSLSQHNYDNCSQLIIEPIPVEEHPSNSSIKNVHHQNTIVPNIEYADNSIDDIDLTQNSNTSEELSQTLKTGNDGNIDASNESISKAKDSFTLRNSQSCSSLGKKDDISIDYDDFIKNSDVDELVNLRNTNKESVVSEKSFENVNNFSRNISFISSCSQTSEIFEISDQELDYSIHKSKLEIPVDNFDFDGISIMDEPSKFGKTKASIETNYNSVNDVEIENLITVDSDKMKSNEISPIKHRRITEIATPQKACSSDMITAITPKNNEVIIKTNNITPMRDYESMSTPDILKELDKYGIKPFKRKRAIQLLTHIYNQTHPIIEAADDIASPPKRRKHNPPSPRKNISPRKLLTSPRKLPKDITKNIPDIDKGKENNVIHGNIETNSIRKGKGKGKSSLENINKDMQEKPTENIQNNISEINGVPILKEIECSPEDWVFQKREKAKVHSCRVPLHVAFYNYVSSRRELREAILCYAPVEIDLIHKDLVAYGHKYDPKDLLKFLDKKCITVKTTDNDARSQKR